MVLPISVQKKQNLPPFRALSAKLILSERARGKDNYNEILVHNTKKSNELNIQFKTKQTKKQSSSRIYYFDRDVAVLLQGALSALYRAKQKRIDEK